MLSIYTWISTAQTYMLYLVKGLSGAVSVYKKQVIKQTVGLELVTEGMMLRIAGN